jgi:hypothetical protein
MSRSATQAMDPAALEKTIAGIALAARAASRRTAELTRDRKDAWLLRAAERLEAARERCSPPTAPTWRRRSAPASSRRW